MKLNRVEITNYRSIKNETVRFDMNCKVLVGINESGKSNILRALSMLSPRYKTETSDERQSLPDENDTPAESRIRFVFSLEKDDYDSILESLFTSVKVAENAKVLNDETKDYTLKQLLKLQTEGLYNVDIPESYLTDATVDDVLRAVGTGVCSRIKSAMPNVIFWEYSDKDLLPTQISLAKFTEDPSSFIPLRNMFHLAGVQNIADEIRSTKARGITVLDNLLKRVALHTTNYLAEV
jgi:predicted ATP-dependent endonuclease of OLD family